MYERNGEKKKRPITMERKHQAYVYNCHVWYLNANYCFCLQLSNLFAEIFLIFLLLERSEYLSTFQKNTAIGSCPFNGCQSERRRTNDFTTLLIWLLVSQSMCFKNKYAINDQHWNNKCKFFALWMWIFKNRQKQSPLGNRRRPFVPPPIWWSQNFLCAAQRISVKEIIIV